MTSDTLRILVLMATSAKARRDKLSGVYAYAHEHGWTVRTVEENVPTDELRRQLAERPPHGIVCDGFRPPVALPRALVSNLPTVYTDLPLEKRKGRCSVNHDDGATARLAAETLLRLRLDDYAAVGTEPGVFWSKLRMRAFREAIESAGCRCHLRTRRDRDLGAWLAALPKPCGIFAVTDRRAKEVIERCAEMGIAVPDDVAVVGVDNEELICENTTPSISSILPDFRQAGYRAAEKLDRLMRGDLPENERESAYGPQTVIRRASTRRLPSRPHKIPAVLEYIRKNACLGIRVPDVIRFAEMPKSTLELNFRRTTSRSIAEEIQRVRLESVCTLLKNTALPIGLVAQRCGYRDNNHLKNLFKRTFSMSMRDYRSFS